MKKGNDQQCGADPPQINKGNPELKTYASTAKKLHDKNVRKGLVHTRRFGITTPRLLDACIGNENRNTGFCKMLVSKGLVRCITTESGGIRGLPRKIAALTPAGLAMAEEEFAPVNKYELNPERYKFDTLHHDLMVQQLTIAHMNKGDIKGFITEKEIGAKTKYSKRPDAVWITDSGDKVMLEVELSGKWQRDFDEFCLRVVKSLLNEDYLMMVLASTSQALLERYAKKLQPGKHIQLWEKSPKTKRWITAGKFSIPETIKGRITCLKITSI